MTQGVFGVWEFGLGCFRGKAFFLLLLLGGLFSPVQVRAQNGDWPMVAANPARTSWTSEEITGSKDPVWFKPFAPYISQKTQIIATDGKLFISTAGGLYALDASSGAELWVYPTALPLGNSPTIVDGVAYVGGFDRKLHAVDVETGKARWTFETGAGIHANPVVIDARVYVGSRDGIFYALEAEGSNAGGLAWSFEAAGPISQSAAYADGVLYFGAQPDQAYAITASDGSLIWNQTLRYAAGLHSWWPVLRGDRVVFSVSNAYRTSFEGAVEWLGKLDSDTLFADRENLPRGSLYGTAAARDGDWAAGTPSIDATAVLDYFAEHPYRRSVFVLDRATGQDTETAPVLFTGTRSGSRFPPVLGGDGVFYQQNHYYSDPAIDGGQVSGWVPGSPYISVISQDWAAIDEPHAVSAGGNCIYWNLCCDRQAGGIDISKPNTLFLENVQNGRSPTEGSDPAREFSYFNYMLLEHVPNYNQRFFGADETPYAAFGGPNGVYGYHGDTNPPIPYQGMIYMHRSNAIIAFGDTEQSVLELPTAEYAPAEKSPPKLLGEAGLKEKLKEEIEKMLDAGHLRPGFQSHGIFDLRSKTHCDVISSHYFVDPSETLVTLAAAFPYLDAELQERVKTYMQSELENFSPASFVHMGWQEGQARESFELPPDVVQSLQTEAPQTQLFNFSWEHTPSLFYALYKSAEILGNAETLFEQSKSLLEEPLADAYLLERPWVLNLFIGGYIGFLELEKLAAQPQSTNVAQTLDRLIRLRSNGFSKDSRFSQYGKGNDTGSAYCRTLNVAGNFLHLVFEHAGQFRQSSYYKVLEAMDEYVKLAPFWFVSKAEEGYAENAITPNLDSIALFLAHAWVLRVSGPELEAYLDVPAFERGDLYFIQKLAANLYAYENNPVDAPPPSQASRTVVGGCCSVVPRAGAERDRHHFFVIGVVTLMLFFFRRRI